MKTASGGIIVAHWAREMRVEYHPFHIETRAFAQMQACALTWCPTQPRKGIYDFRFTIYNLRN